MPSSCRCSAVDGGDHGGAADSLPSSRVAHSASWRFSERIVFTPVAISDNLSRIWIRKSNCSARSASLVVDPRVLEQLERLGHRPVADRERGVVGAGLGERSAGRLWNSVSTIFTPLG